MPPGIRMVIDPGLHGFTLKADPRAFASPFATCTRTPCSTWWLAPSSGECGQAAEAFSCATKALVFPMRNCRT